MRIAFDLDDTLVPTTKPFKCGSKSLSLPINLLFKEPLRKGASKLLRSLQAEHEVWIYTTSLRSRFYIKTWFFLNGVYLGGVVNQEVHQKAINRTNSYAGFSKAPKLFGIDLLIDDSDGVLIECKQQGCNCIIVKPEDDDWVGRILSNISK